VEVAGRKMQLDFEPVLERQLHYFINGASGIQHIGQRDIVWMRISKNAYAKGFRLRHIGDILHARFHADFGAIVDKVQIKIITDPKAHAEWLHKAREAYDYRNRRLADMTDESVDTFYSCILCQSFAPNHVCVVSPQRLGLCGAYNWLDCKASYEINPTGPNQPIIKGTCTNPVVGYWEGTNEYAKHASHGSVPEVSLYSIMNNPMTACGCFECIVMFVPEANGVMVVSREDAGMTPAGMAFSTLAGIAGGGIQSPGMMGVGKYYLLSPKFISADGGFKRVVWMSANLKDSMAEELKTVAEREGDPDLVSRIADGRAVTTVEELVSWLKEHEHPALAMPSMAAQAEAAAEAEAVAVAEAKPAASAAAAPAAPVAHAAPAPAAPAPEPVKAAASPAPAPKTEVKPEPAAPAAPVEPAKPAVAPAPAAPVAANVDLRAVAEMSAEIIVDKLRGALMAALRELGGTVPAPAAAPGAAAAAPAPTAPAPVAEAKAEEPAAPVEAAPAPAPKKERPAPVAAPWIKDPKAGVELAKEKWTGKVLEITLGATAAQGGTRTKTLTLGGHDTLSYLFYEGKMPHRPAVAIEIADKKPEDWSPLLMEAWGEALNDPGTWAKAAEAKGASAIVLQLSATLADGQPNTAANARAVVRKVLGATGLPLIVYGPGQTELDNELLVAVAEEGKGERLVLGKCEEKNYRTIVAAALANDHLVIASTAMDVNLAKQLNILISDMGIPLDRIVMDPTCAAVGYGLEYGYSVMERLRVAALTGDKMTQLPMIVTVGYEAWRQKENKVGEGVPAAWGDWKERAINWETVTASALVESAADLIALRHPTAVSRVQAMIDQLVAGQNQGG